MNSSMKHVAWLTDIHLDFLDPHEIDAFCQSVAHSGADAILLGGDISTAPRIRGHLLLLEKHLQRPIYFVLGNHDAYGGSIVGARSVAASLARDSRWLNLEHSLLQLKRFRPGCWLAEFTDFRSRPFLEPRVRNCIRPSKSSIAPTRHQDWQHVTRSKSCLIRTTLTRHSRVVW